MFKKPPDMIGKAEEEFSQPVESIMRCEDFKSNFARRLSNRYISRTPVTPRQDTALKLLPTTHPPENAPERIEQCFQLSKSITEQNVAVQHPGKKADRSHLRNTEVSVLNMEVETLRWQLSQTEANRQMHIALLKQIVSFLSRVKEHIECQKPEMGSRKETMSARITPRSFNIADLPRSRSVVHVNKTMEYSLSPAKKIATRKISKSISNVNGYRDYNKTWTPSNMSLTCETESTHKITEEMSRLITLANTVISTKLPDLACANSEYDNNSIVKSDEISQETNSALSLNFIEEDTTGNPIILNTSSNKTCLDIVDKFVEAKDRSTQNPILPPSPLTNDLTKDLAHVKIENENTSKLSETSVKTHGLVEKRNEYNAANFIEDESGFSSMNSFQEIGIPIISIIPPSPCKDVGYIDDIAEILEDKWKSDSLELDKQAVKVFWV